MLALSAAMLLPGVMAMHLRLVKSAPAKGEIVTQLPTDIKLWFSQKPDVGLTSVKLLREDSTSIPVGKVARTDDSLAVKAPLETALVPGTYTVSWRSVSKDGHAVRGSYNFNVAPAPPGQTLRD
jgi:methionine-rich copper-binding protein CopC